MFSHPVTQCGTPSSCAFWLLAILLIAAFILGGSARGDVQSLIILRPLAAVMLGVGLWKLKFEHFRRNKFLAAMMLAILALPMIQLIPLPYAMWSHFSGRQLVVEIDLVAGLGQIARPISLAPDATLNSLLSLLVPSAVFVLGVQLDKAALDRLLPVLLGLAGVSALIGLVQTLDMPNGPLYFYDITNPGSAVGLFANRNHQALLLAMALPMLGVWASEHDQVGPVRKVGAIVGVLALLPLILITGSRAGAISGLLALLSIFLIVPRRSPNQPGASLRGRPWNVQAIAARAGAIALVSGLIALTVLLGRAEAWDRFQSIFRDDDLRFRILPTLAGMFLKYWPLGTGIGSFEKIFQANEPDELLGPVYMNHAHNDWLELPLTGGLPGACLLLVSIAATAASISRNFRRTTPSAQPDPFARLGLIVILLAGFASLSDYPLRTPSLASVFVVAVLWASCPLSRYGAWTGPSENQSDQDRNESKKRQHAQ